MEHQKAKYHYRKYELHQDRAEELDRAATALEQAEKRAFLEKYYSHLTLRNIMTADARDLIPILDRVVETIGETGILFYDGSRRVDYAKSQIQQVSLSMALDKKIDLIDQIITVKEAIDLLKATDYGRKRIRILEDRTDGSTYLDVTDPNEVQVVKLYDAGRPYEVMNFGSLGIALRHIYENLKCNETLARNQEVHALRVGSPIEVKEVATDQVATKSYHAMVTASTGTQVVQTTLDLGRNLAEEQGMVCIPSVFDVTPA